MHQEDSEKFKWGLGGDELHPDYEEELNNEDISKIMVYGHSAICSNGAISPLEEYISILKSDKFFVYLDIYSFEKDSQYYVHICILDQTKTIPDMEKVLYFEYLDKTFKTWLTSYLMVFEPNFPRKVLNFEIGKRIPFSEYYEAIRSWLPSGIKENEGEV